MRVNELDDCERIDRRDMRALTEVMSVLDEQDPHVAGADDMYLVIPHSGRECIVDDRETQHELEEKIYDKARDRGGMGDYEGAQWYKDAAFKIGEANLEVPA